jgi:hypothetical protein
VEGQRIDTEWYGKGSKDCISEFCDSGWRTSCLLLSDCLFVCVAAVTIL